ncbi:DM DNA binding domain protein [Cooperia oncophora]
MHDNEDVEIDVVALSPAPSQSSCNSAQNEKKYFCQRCLNHDLQFPRKGHKPVRQLYMQRLHYGRATAPTEQHAQQVQSEFRIDVTLEKMSSSSGQLQMVESPRETVNGRRIRDPQCARCRQHGIRVPLRGHKRVLCQFANCKCEMVSCSNPYVIWLQDSSIRSVFRS